MPPSLTPQAFIEKWRLATLKERSASQEHFIDICRMVGHLSPAEMDPTGQFFTFEAGATKTSGGEGWADVWYKGRFAWEYKGKHADLEKAYQQLLQYHEALESPPLLIVSDIDTIVIHTKFLNSVKQVYRLAFEDLLIPDRLAFLRAAFFNPEELRAPVTTADVTKEAAAQFARLADLLRKKEGDPARIAHFLIQLLFCLFSEDVGLLPEGLFTRMVQQTRTRPDAFNQQLRLLFSQMASGGWFGTEEIVQFNGHLFTDDSVLDLDVDGLAVLSQVTSLNWSSIEPSIFGTLFERSLDPGKRAQLGAHYTSREDILLIVEPVLMAPLRREWEEVKSKARALAFVIEKSKASQRSKSKSDLEKLLLGFAQKISKVQILDPACGSGNFLYVALRQLLDLEKEVINLAGDLGLGRFFPSVSPAQLHGIEINEYAHQLAQATIWIGYIQWMKDNGFGFSVPVLKTLDNILLMDAILAYDEDGNPVEPEWPPADVIIGNPPFLGGNRVRQELGDEYVDLLFKLYDRRVPAFADLVCYWFEKASAQISNKKSMRAGLLATQGIRGGANRKVLERIKQSGDIFWAQSDRNWVLDGATVHVSMIAFDDGSQTGRSLNNIQVVTINSDLTTSSNLTLANKLDENRGLCFYGSQQKGSFDISAEKAIEIISHKNSFGLSYHDVVKRGLNARQLLGREKETWVIDFGVEMTLEQASMYEAAFDYVKQIVYPERKERRETRQKDYWWLHARPSPRYRAMILRQNRYIATPCVSKHRIFVWLNKDVLADHAIVVFAREDFYFFGVLQSKVNELWARALGTQVREAESGFRYTPSSTFETFPFPWPPGQEPQDDSRVQAIAQAAEELVEKRDAWLNPPGASEAELKKRTLTNLYNQRPTWLDLAHRKLDQAVMDAYGWPHDLSDEEILERLLALNLERAEKG